MATTLCSSPRSTPAASSPSQPNPQHVSPPTSARRSALPTTRSAGGIDRSCQPPERVVGEGHSRLSPQSLDKVGDGGSKSCGGRRRRTPPIRPGGGDAAQRCCPAWGDDDWLPATQPGLTPRVSDGDQVAARHLKGRLALLGAWHFEPDTLAVRQRLAAPTGGHLLDQPQAAATAGPRLRAASERPRRRHRGVIDAHPQPRAVAVRPHLYVDRVGMHHDIRDQLRRQQQSRLGRRRPAPGRHPFIEPVPSIPRRRRGPRHRHPHRQSSNHDRLQGTR